MWLILEDYFKNKFERKNLWLYSLLVLLMLGGIAINNIYYQESTIYHEIYSTKGRDLFNLAGRTLAMGHYFFQLLIPYWLSFNYEVSAVSSYLGLFFLTGLCFLIYKSNADKKAIFSWSIFCLLPLTIVSTDSGLLSDTYLLIPAVGLLIILILVLQKKNVGSNPSAIFLLMLTFWGVYTFTQTLHWKNSVDFSLNDFEKSPSCKSGFLNARLSYYANEKINSDIKSYLVGNKCFAMNQKNMGSNFATNEYITVLCYMLCYENEFSEEQKIQELKKWSKHHYLASFFLAAIYIKNQNFVAADSIIKKEIERSGEISSYTYEPVVVKRLYPYCLKNPQNDCENFMKFFSHKSQRPFFE
jgi:hypothetical protein